MGIRSAYDSLLKGVNTKVSAIIRRYRKQNHKNHHSVVKKLTSWWKGALITRWLYTFGLFFF